MSQGLNMSEKEKLPKGQARIQFVANSERIKELSAQGYDIFKIFCVLREEQRVSMSYTSFHDNFTRRRKSRKERKFANVPAIIPSNGNSGPPVSQTPLALPSPASLPPPGAAQSMEVDVETSLRRIAEEQSHRQASASEYLQSTTKDVLNGRR